MELHLDLAATTPLNPIWSFGGNTCHAPLWLRDDLQRQLARCQRELGFRYVRAHGLLCDRMEIVQPDGSFRFDKVSQAFDKLLASGLRPFVELSHLPTALSRDPGRHICAYRFQSAPPKDFSRWHALVKALVAHLKARYGRDEVAQWYFEVWNEPDIAFWSGTQAEYFRLYDLAARAVKEVDASFRIGGPATSKTAWIDEFLAHLAKPSRDIGLDLPRCDFISTHAYPSDVEFVDCDRGAVKLVNSNIMRHLFAEVRRKVDAALGPGFPVICGEWNSSAGPLAWNHDQCNNAAYVAKTMVELSDLCQGSLYWDISDIYEECQFHYEPFHGGYGILTVNDLPKSAYHAFAFLHEHRGQRLAARWSEARDGVGALASRDGQTLRVLVYAYQEPVEGKAVAATMHNREDSAVRAARPVEVTLRGLPGTVTRAELRRVLPGRGSAYEAWLALGSPVYPTRDLLEKLEAASRPDATTIDPRQPLCLPPGAIAQLTCTL